MGIVANKEPGSAIGTPSMMIATSQRPPRPPLVSIQGPRTDAPGSRSRTSWDRFCPLLAAWSISSRRTSFMEKPVEILRPSSSVSDSTTRGASSSALCDSRTSNARSASGATKMVRVCVPLRELNECELLLTCRHASNGENAIRVGQNRELSAYDPHRGLGHGSLGPVVNDASGHGGGTLRAGGSRRERGPKSPTNSTRRGRTVRSPCEATHAPLLARRAPSGITRSTQCSKDTSKAYSWVRVPAIEDLSTEDLSAPLSLTPSEGRTPFAERARCPDRVTTSRPAEMIRLDGIYPWSS